MNALELWNSLLEADRQTWLDGLAEFRKDLVAAKVSFGGRSLCNHLRPKFLTEVEYQNLRRDAEGVLAGVMQAYERMLEEPKLMSELRLRPMERELISPDPGYAHVAPCARLDSFITPTGPRFVELNGECPAGPAYSERLAAAFLDHPLTKKFAERATIRPISTLPPLLETLLSCWREWGGTSSPTIAIVDYEGLPTATEFELCREYFESQGYTALVSDPRALEYDGEHLTAQGRKIDLVYKRVLMNEFLERFDEVKQLFHAYRDRRVCMVNPFRSKLVHKKVLFAILTADDRDEWMATEHRKVIDRAVPWTRRVAEMKTRYAGQKIDLLPHLAAHREQFVLKPNDEYGGKGITLGWEVAADEWEKRLGEAVAADYVVQERVVLVPEQFPAMDADFATQQLFVDLDPYLYLGKMQGALARLGAGGLCNVTSGGGQVPLFVVGDVA